MLRPHSLLRGSLLLAPLALACGDSAAPQDGTAASTTGDAASTTTGEAGNTTVAATDDPAVPTTGSVDPTTTSDSTSSTTGAPGPCDRVHEGDLVVEDGTDLSVLADIGHVTGSVYVFTAGRGQKDLSFLECVHTIDGALIVQGTEHLESTAGMANLQTVQRIWVTQNKGLLAVEGFDQVVQLVELKVHWNPSLEQIAFDSLANVATMTLGHCAGESGLALQPLLLDMTGFSGLTSVGNLNLDGHETLVTADLLDALATNGAASPVATATVRFNAMLDEATIHAQLDALGLSMRGREVCGNAAGDPECSCLVGS